MVVNVPFRHWVCVKNPWQESPRRALYYLETIEGQQVIVAVAIRAGGNQLVYQPFVDFVQDYRNILPLPHVLMWNYSFQLNAWLDDIVYHSFVRCSNEAYFVTAGLHSACLPSAFMAHQTVLKFGYFHLQHVQLQNVCDWNLKLRLEHAFNVLGLEQMVINMANRTWLIPIHNLHLNAEAFNEFLAVLDLQLFDYLMLTMLPTDLVQLTN
ncbi:hypothetical protein RHGRI_020477 [Rhododendron griersonianum]|uniref:Uncharacterized protein n=1 Tax=Rhododendron griersonianum TaxID=479676 RepID=A0AAV6JJD2_9ERIC|nr:hypothetical protein RHGRI_020477 [Rhododendron griersonianum]